MHELSIVQGIVRSIERQREKHGFSRLRAVELVCGKYNCLSEESLQFYFNAAAKSSFMEGARLRVVRLGERYHCLSCGARSAPEGPLGGACPACGSGEVLVEFDHDVYIRHIEVE